MNGDLTELGEMLFDYVNNYYYQPSEANYCYIDSVKISYDEDVAYVYEIRIEWGRDYTGIDDSKTHLNEGRITIFDAEFDYNNPYVILGQFIQAIKIQEVHWDESQQKYR